MLNLSNVQFALLISLIAGLSSLIGAAFIFAFKGFSMRRIAMALGFSAGIMIYLSFFELLPESIAMLNHKYLTIFFFALGTLVAYIIDIITHYFLDKDGNHDDNIVLLAKESGNKIKCDTKIDKTMMKTGIFIAIAIALHNLPEGIVTFTSALLNPYLGLGIALAVSIHNIPEGFCVALPIYCSSQSRIKGLIYAFIAGIAEPIGALLAWLILANYFSDNLMGALLGIVSGIMFYVAVDELIPAAKKLGDSHLSILGIIYGIIFMFLMMLFVNYL